MLQRLNITKELRRWSDGDEAALERLLPMLYEELKQIAHRRLRSERPDHTMNTTALVHEAYLRLVEVNEVQWQDRAHFLAMASRMMRRILVDYALRQKAQKRGGGESTVPLDEERHARDEQVETVLDLHEALERLELEHPRSARAVELKYFGGLTLEESGEALGVAPATVMRDLRFAEAWLGREWRRRGKAGPS
jgi:RNA polymerase sigma factor (TIGR02999 family)